MNRDRYPQTRLEGALDPGMIKGSMLFRKMEAAFRCDDLLMQQSLLARIEEGEGTASIRIIMPHVRYAHFEFRVDLRMDNRHNFKRLNSSLWGNRPDHGCDR